MPFVPKKTKQKVKAGYKSLYLSVELIEKVEQIAKENHTSFNQQFVQHECMEYKYVNREEDTGAEGLRKAKLSYRPAFLEEKGIVKETE